MSVQNFQGNLNKILERHEHLSGLLIEGSISGDEFVKISKEYSDLSTITEKINHYFKVINELEDVELMSNEDGIDSGTKELIEEELSNLKQQIPILEKDLMIALLPKDIDDEKNAIIEIRAGTGGDEAALFVSDLFNMYHRYAQSKGWKFEILSISSTGANGYKEISALVKGVGAFSKLKYESGVHRVQRVPETESSGRLHTSAATVAVLPEVQDIDVHIDDKDLKIDTFRASGAGGQHVNTTDSAVRITHIPTGIAVSLQDEKSQHKNKAKALKILRSRLYEIQKKEKDLERSLSRKDQIGSGDRSERIRTYNFPQGRVSDHRINLTVYNKMDLIIKSGQLDEFIDALIVNDEGQKLASKFHYQN
ncbi:MAG: peptide chain release factor 1 [Rickettsiaceae bacterium]